MDDKSVAVCFSNNDFMFGHFIRKYESSIKPHAVGIGIALLVAYFLIGIIF